jgi:hypothetical protein
MGVVPVSFAVSVGDKQELVELVSPVGTESGLEVHKNCL